MTSISQEHLLPQGEQAMTAVLCEAAERLARPSGLIVRQGKVTGASFAQTLVLGWLANPQATLEDLRQQAAEVGLLISAQGLDQRFTEAAGRFWQTLFEVTLAQVVVADPVAIALLERFGAGCLEDCCTIRLPAELAESFRGAGGQGSPAACKVFVRLDMLRGGLSCAPLQDGRRADAASPLKGGPTPARTLYIRDRGFTDVTQWQEETERGQVVLSDVRRDGQLCDEPGRPLDLARPLPQSADWGEWLGRVGPAQVPMRLFFERVPEAVAQQRRRRLKRAAAKQGKTLSARVDLLAGWTIVVTTVPAALLSLEEALILLRLRWQIELLFKLWKEHGKVDEWRTKNAQRILCEVSAKRIGLLFQHWLLLLSCWQQSHRSLVKAAKAGRRHVVLLSTALAGELTWSVALGRMQSVAQPGARLNSRRDAPNTSQLLLSGHNVWSGKPLRKRRLS